MDWEWAKVGDHGEGVTGSVDGGRGRGAGAIGKEGGAVGAAEQASDVDDRRVGEADLGQVRAFLETPGRPEDVAVWLADAANRQWLHG
ncbi:hypothetical protein B1218_34640, partial [Pseudomonas ogarae]